MTFSYKRCARVLTLVAVSLLGLALLVRALVAFIEALAVLLLAVVVALPRGISWYWRQARREIPRLLRNLGDLLDTSASEPKAAADGQARTE